VTRHRDSKSEAVVQLRARFERNARRQAAEASTRRALNDLDRHRWHVEQSVLIAHGVCTSFVVVGPTGVFALVASDGPWSFSDLKLLARATRPFAALVPYLARRFHPAIVVASSAAEPREWFADDGSGAWVLGDELLVPWLHSFPDGGLDSGDIADLRKTARLQSRPSASGRLEVDLSRRGPAG
jgi:hypothetical protein